MATDQLHTAAGRNLDIDNTDIRTAPGVVLDDRQRTIVGSILELYDAKPSHEKLQFWKEDAVFEEPLLKAQGRNENEAHWNCLAAMVSKAERLSHQVTSAGNPIQLDQSMAYILKGIGMKVTMHSKINIFIDPASGKIKKVEDRWKTTFPDATISNVHFKQLISPGWWLYYAECWVWWAWSFVWWTRFWEPIRRLNAVTMLTFFGSPKYDAENTKKGK